LAARTARRGGDFDGAVRELELYRQRRGFDAALERELKLLRLQQGELSAAGPLLPEALDGPAGPDAALVLEAYLVGALTALAPPPEFGRTFVGGPPPPETARMLRAADRWLSLRDGKADQVQGLVWRGRARALAGDYPNAVAD